MEIQLKKLYLENFIKYLLWKRKNHLLNLIGGSNIYVVFWGADKVAHGFLEAGTWIYVVWGQEVIQFVHHLSEASWIGVDAYFELIDVS